MERANGKNFFAACDDLKRKASCKVSNLFMDSHELSRKLAGHDCCFHQAGQSIFLLAPFHGVMRSLFFISSSLEAMASDFPSLLRHNEMRVPIRTSIIGHEELCGSLVAILENNGFRIMKKLLRMRLVRPADKVIAAMRTLAAGHISLVSFAEEGDAEEISALLREEFDIVGDNIPELDEIRESIRRKSVTVIRMSGGVAALHYFHIENGIAHFYFEITRKGFRSGNGMLFALYIFEDEYFQKMGIKIKRAYGWLEAARARLVKNYSQRGTFPDGIVIYNMLREAEPYKTKQDGYRP